MCNCSQYSDTQTVDDSRGSPLHCGHPIPEVDEGTLGSDLLHLSEYMKALIVKRVLQEI